MENNLNFIELRIKTVDELLKETHAYIKWQAPGDVEYIGLYPLKKCKNAQ